MQLTTVRDPLCECGGCREAITGVPDSIPCLTIEIVFVNLGVWALFDFSHWGECLSRCTQPQHLYIDDDTAHSTDGGRYHQQANNTHTISSNDTRCLFCCVVKLYVCVCVHVFIFFFFLFTQLNQKHHHQSRATNTQRRTKYRSQACAHSPRT